MNNENLIIDGLAVASFDKFNNNGSFFFLNDINLNSIPESSYKCIFLS
jgi:hypothetical protein